MPRSKSKAKGDARHVKEIDESCFDPQRLDLYWRFLAERQLVQARRVGGVSGPWTTDPILQTEFITNMYREIDPGTVYVIEEILELEKPADVVFNVMMYRVMGSQRRTHELVTQPAKGFEPQDMISTLREAAADIDFKVFGDAYRVASYHVEGGQDKIENVAMMFKKFAVGMPETMRRLKAATSVKDAYEVFKGTAGLGDFLAHQITTDLLYGADSVLPFSDDDFAVAGPGARSGIWALMAPGVKPSSLGIVMEWLRDHQAEEFEKRGIEFPWLVNYTPVDDEDEYVRLSLCNIQSTLCEYYKYVRIWTGEKTGTVRKYDWTTAQPLEVGYVLKDTPLTDALHPALTPPPPEPDPEELTADVPTKDEETSLLDNKSFELTPTPGFSTVLHSPDGRAVHITININLGS